MYYYKLNSTDYPTYRPYRLRLDNGLTITNPTEEQLFENGWVKALEKPSFIYPQTVDWVNYAWVIREPNELEVEAQWLTVKLTCQQKLAESDYRVIKATEAAALKGTTLLEELPTVVLTYRQALRDIYNNVNNLNPFFIEWPSLEESQDGN